MASHGTKHHKLHGYVGWGLIIGLPFAAFSAVKAIGCLLYTSPSPRDQRGSRMPSSA